MTRLTLEQKTETMNCLYREIRDLEEWNRRDKHHPQAIPANTQFRNKRITTLRGVHEAIKRSAAVLLLDQPTFPEP